MALQYLKHDDTRVQIYPSANRLMEMDYKARLTDEFNVTNLVNRVLDTDAFVITNNRYNNNGINIGISNDVFEFSIKGYYFRVNESDEIINLFDSFSDGEMIYANMYLGQVTRTLPNTNPPETYVSQSLCGIVEDDGEYKPTFLDEVEGENTRFLGIGFSKEKVTAPNVYSFPIIMRENIGGASYNVIPQESKIKLQSTAFTDISVKISDGIL